MLRVGKWIAIAVVLFAILTRAALVNRREAPGKVADVEVNANEKAAEFEKRATECESLLVKVRTELNEQTAALTNAGVRTPADVERSPAAKKIALRIARLIAELRELQRAQLRLRDAAAEARAVARLRARGGIQLSDAELGQLLAEKSTAQSWLEAIMEPTEADAHAVLERLHREGSLNARATQAELEAENAALRRSIEAERTARGTLEARVAALERMKISAETQIEVANHRANESEKREQAVRAELGAVRREIAARDESVGELQRQVRSLIETQTAAEREREKSTHAPVRAANNTRKDYGTYAVYYPTTSSPYNVTEPRGWSTPRRDPNRPDYGHSTFRGR